MGMSNEGNKAMTTVVTVSTQIHLTFKQGEVPTGNKLLKWIQLCLNCCFQPGRLSQVSA